MLRLLCSHCCPFVICPCCLCLQTQQYPRVRQHYQTTNGHFHDDPVQLEPSKLSTVGKLYENSLYFMEKRLEKAPRKATHTELETLGSTTLPTYKTLSIPGSWSGRLPPCYEGNGEGPACQCLPQPEMAQRCRSNACVGRGTPLGLNRSRSTSPHAAQGSVGVG